MNCGQRLGQLGLAHAGGAEEDEGADRALGIFQARARAAHRFGNRHDRFILPDDALVQFFFHVHQARRFFAGDLRDRDARPHRHHLGDVFRQQHAAHRSLRDSTARAGHRSRSAVLLRARADRRRRRSGALPAPASRSRCAALSSPIGLLQALGLRRFVHAHARRTLVDQVDGLVGQEAIGDVALGQHRRRSHRFVGDAQLVMALVARAHALENFNRFFNRRLFHQDRLETALQRGIAFDVLAIFIQRRRADALQFAARQRRLQDVGRIDRRSGRARADQHVHFVDEQDAVAVLDLFDHALEALFKLAAIHRARHQRAHVELQHALVEQRLRRIAVDDALRQPFDDGGLAHARLADQRRIVLGAAREDLDHALDFGLPPDHRIELAFFGRRRQIGRQLIDHRRLGAFLLGLRRLRRAAGSAFSPELGVSCSARIVSRRI